MLLLESILIAKNCWCSIVSKIYHIILPMWDKVYVKFFALNCIAPILYFLSVFLKYIFNQVYFLNVLFECISQVYFSPILSAQVAGYLCCAHLSAAPQVCRHQCSGSGAFLQCRAEQSSAMPAPLPPVHAMAVVPVCSAVQWQCLFAVP